MNCIKSSGMNIQKHVKWLNLNMITDLRFAVSLHKKSQTPVYLNVW